MGGRKTAPRCCVVIHCYVVSKGGIKICYNFFYKYQESLFQSLNSFKLFRRGRETKPSCCVVIQCYVERETSKKIFSESFIFAVPPLPALLNFCHTKKEPPFPFTLQVPCKDIISKKTVFIKMNSLTKNINSNFEIKDESNFLKTKQNVSLVNSFKAFVS